jgi:hypothetical protein
MLLGDDVLHLEWGDDVGGRQVAVFAAPASPPYDLVSRSDVHRRVQGPFSVPATSALSDG